LVEHTKEEVMDAGNEVYCSVCKEHKTAKKEVKFMRQYLPEILIVSLKRFEFRDASLALGHGAAHREKIEELVDFPINGLDLSAYCAPSSLDHGATEYDLFAVCNHYGRMGYGHYTATARDWVDLNTLRDQWYTYDDNDVIGPFQSAEAIPEIITKNAYILFYRKRKPGKEAKFLPQIATKF
jgi:ubiquitin carboxyl-terminal hydrolase 4/11